MVVAPAYPKVFNVLSAMDQLYKRTRTWFELHAKKFILLLLLHNFLFKLQHKFSSLGE